MSDTQTIALDAMGGDFGPQVVVPAAAMAAAEVPGLRFLLVGDEKAISPVLEHSPELAGRAEVVHTEEVISNDEKPSAALRYGRGSSMRLTLDSVKEGRAAAAVSGGNTGALMAMAKYVLKSLPGISRPAIASVFPTMKNDSIMLDLGANLECAADNLVQFAILGSVYAKTRLAMAGRPSVGILNVGTEEMKGNESVRNAAATLREIDFPGRFHGYIEGNDIPKGTVDVVVTDGFTGNVALKVAEGMGLLSGHFIRDAFRSSPWAMLGGLLAMGAMKRLKKRVDPRYYNGGIFLGLNGVCVKSHGGSDVYGFYRAILVASELAGCGYNDLVASEVNRLSQNGKLSHGTATSEKTEELVSS